MQNIGSALLHCESQFSKAYCRDTRFTAGIQCVISQAVGQLACIAIVYVFLDSFHSSPLFNACKEKYGHIRNCKDVLLT